MNRRSQIARLRTGGLIGASTASLPGDEHWDDVVLLLDGTDPATDLSTQQQTVTETGSSTGFSNETDPFGNTQDVLDFTRAEASGSGYQVSSSPITFGSDPFTIEMWIKLDSASLTSTQLLYSERSSGTTCVTFRVANQKLTFFKDNSAGGLFQGATTLAADTWYHVALTYDSSTVRLFLDGQLDGSSNQSLTFNPNVAPVLGYDRAFPETTYQLDGRMAQVRVTKGVARYTANFTPPTQKFLPFAARPNSGTFGLGDEHWNDVTLLLDGSSLTDDLSTANNDVSRPANTNAVTLLSTTGPYSTTQDVLDFNRTTDSHLVGTAGDLADLDDGDPWTMECWVKLDAVGDAGQAFSDWHGVFGVSAASSATEGIAVRWNATAWEWWVNGYNNKGSFAQTRPTNVWKHVALVYDGAGSSTLYVNGVASSALSQTCALGTSDRVVLGRVYANTAAQPLAGNIADFRVTKGVARYTAAFTPPTASLPTNAPVVGRRGVGTYDTGDEHWNDVKLLIDGSFTDASTAGNNLTSVGGANVLSMTGPYGTTQNVLNFDGTNDYAIEATASGDFSFGTDDFTIEAWLKADVDAPSVVPGVIDYDYSNASTVQGKNDYFVLHQMSSTRTYAFYANNTSGTVVKLVEASFPNLTDFHHVAITRSGSTVKMFINGVLEATSTNVLVADMTSNRVNPKLLLGYQDLVSRYWNGKMADVRITKGVARYTDDFTPPTASLPTVLTGTPETTKTLRTRGYLGEAPAAIDPADHFKAVTYTGNGTSKQITGVGFEPGFVWAKRRDEISAGVSASHAVFDVLRGAEKRLRTDTDGVEVTQPGVTGFDADGFTLGTNAGVNPNGGTMVAWCLKAGGAVSANNNTDGSITSTVSANVEAGFSVVGYAGTNAAGTIGHGLDQAPELLIIKSRDDTGGTQWNTYSEPTGPSQKLLLNTTAQAAATGLFSNTAPTSTVFSVGTQSGAAETNKVGYNFIAYCFHSVPGFSKVGSYTGDGSTNNYVELGFRPAFVMVKRTDVAANWIIMDNARDPSNPVVGRLFPNSNSKEITHTNTVDFNDSGFTAINNFSEVNATGGDYIYLAFAESNTLSDPQVGMLTLYDRYVDSLT